ncbi:Regulator of chromosome condensation 1/beta-lactamase-inhibitor protein II [Parasponia andersonii]|uniref:Regulator of chromosome condensation 1/beta-lactamase-inhibitor protein II n=1 Tax=Parasponia andersonii TaxID=3476 RepID=A0A2P5AQC7_PARAD|nr:Regulator of chromosome condensation 1/beta-lactamase-inhibitor protein II [Parasponia andersonii]
MSYLRLRWPLPSSLTRHISSSYSTSTTATTRKVPLLYKPETAEHQDDAVALQLLSWGRGASGQLGGGVEEIRLYPTPVANLLVPSSSFALSPSPGRFSGPNRPKSEEGPNPVEVGISCGLFHSSLVVHGKLWLWGKGDGGRLGFGHENPAFVPTLNPHLDSVRSVALGGLHSVVLTTPGQAFTWGYGGFGALGHSVYHRELLPRLVEGSWGGKIRHIATSGTHTAAITESGELYTWGRDEGDGRLGLGPGRGPNEGGGRSIPSKVKALPVPVAAVSCGGFFTMVLTEDGKVWNWGANSNYELGRGNNVGGWKPNPVSGLQDVRIIQIASGGYHSLALTDDGKVFSWGHGGHGQLGHSSISNQKIPAVIEALANEHAVYIACGGSSSAAITDEGKLFTWGNAKDSQLGVPGLPEVQPSPVMVKFLMEEDGLGPHKVISVAVGASHAMCLVSRSES